MSAGMYPEALLCYTGPSYEGLHYWLISRGAVTSRSRITKRMILSFCYTRSILIIAYFFVNCVKVADNH
nr:MAG TPA: hypothetical protein [Caudoviricetes sp.]